MSRALLALLALTCLPGPALAMSGAGGSVHLVGVLTKQGDLLCDGTYDFKFVNHHHQVGFVRVAASSTVDLAPLEGKPVVVTGRVVRGYVPPPVEHTGECPQVQMRSDWRHGLGGMRVVRGDGPPFPAIEVSAARELEALTVRRAGDQLVVAFSNDLGVALTDVVVRVHYEGCYGKPGHRQQDVTRAALAKGARLEGKLPTLSERVEGPRGRRTHRAASVEVRAQGPGVAFDLDVSLASLGLRVECPDRSGKGK